MCQVRVEGVRSSSTVPTRRIYEGANKATPYQCTHLLPMASTSALDGESTVFIILSIWLIVEVPGKSAWRSSNCMLCAFNDSTPSVATSRQEYNPATTYQHPWCSALQPAISPVHGTIESPHTLSIQALLHPRQWTITSVLLRQLRFRLLVKDYARGRNRQVSRDNQRRGAR